VSLGLTTLNYEPLGLVALGACCALAHDLVLPKLVPMYLRLCAAGEIHPECAHWAYEGQLVVQAQPAWVHERQVLLDEPDLFL